MNPALKSTIVAVILTLACALGGGVGIATLLIMPFDYIGSLLIGVTYIVSAIVCWWWACFARKELYQ